MRISSGFTLCICNFIHGKLICGHSSQALVSFTNKWVTATVYAWTIGDFRVVFRLCFKASPSAKPFIWKLVLFTCKWTKICVQIKLISIRKALHYDSLWNRGEMQLGNCLLPFIPELSVYLNRQQLLSIRYTSSRTTHVLYSIIFTESHSLSICSPSDGGAHSALSVWTPSLVFCCFMPCWGRAYVGLYCK